MENAVRQAGRWVKRARFRVMRVVSPHKRRWNTALNLREFYQRRIRLDSYPQQIQVGCTMACNLRCAFCVRTAEFVKARNAHKKTRLDREMPADVFEQVLALMPYAERFDLTPFGESFLYSQFDRILETHKRQGCANLTMTTAGTLITPKRAEQLVRSGVQHVKISIEETEPERYAALRKGAKLGQVLDGIAHIHEWKERLSSRVPHLTLAASYMQSNIEHLPNMVRFAAERKVPEIYVQMLELKYLDDPELRKEELIYHTPLLKRMIAEAEAEARRLGVALVVTDPIRNVIESSGNGGQDAAGKLGKVRQPVPHRPLIDKCTNPWWWAYIDENGLLWPCCWAKVQFGDLREKSFMDVWNSKVAQDMRRRFLADDIPNYCRGQLCHVDYD